MCVEGKSGRIERTLHSRKIPRLRLRVLRHDALARPIFSQSIQPMRGWIPHWYTRCDICASTTTQWCIADRVMSHPTSCCWGHLLSSVISRPTPIRKKQIYSDKTPKEARDQNLILWLDCSRPDHTRLCRLKRETTDFRFFLLLAQHSNGRGAVRAFYAGGRFRKQKSTNTLTGWHHRIAGNICRDIFNLSLNFTLAQFVSRQKCA